MEGEQLTDFQSLAHLHEGDAEFAEAIARGDAHLKARIRASEADTEESADNKRLPAESSQHPKASA